MAAFTSLKKAALSHMLLRVLCLLIIEHECARLVQQSSGTPAVLGNYLLAAIFLIGFLLALTNLKAGFYIGLGAAAINILAKAAIIIRGHEHFPYYPIVWITQCLIVAGFCYLALSENQAVHRTDGKLPTTAV